MGQSKFVWIIVYDNGVTKNFFGTWDELMVWGIPGPNPLAIVRGEVA